MKSRYYEPGRILYRKGDQVDCLMIVEHGEIEVYSDFEGNEFIIERLPAGSVINQKTLFSLDMMYVNFRASSQSGAYVLILDEDGLLDVREEFESIDKRLALFENKILKRMEKYPLDYTLALPKEQDCKLSRGQLQRENVFKTVVMRKVLEIQEEKRKPKIKDILSRFKSLENKDDKLFVINQLYMLYSKNDKPSIRMTTRVDENLNDVMNKVNQISESLEFQHESIKNI